MITRYERVLDYALAGFALWTLCCHGTVFLGGTGYHLLVAASSVGVLAVAGLALWRRFRSGPAEQLQLVGESTPEPRAVALAAGGFIAGTLAIAIVNVPPMALWWAVAAYVTLAAGYVLSRPALGTVRAGPAGKPYDTSYVLGAACVVFGCLSLSMHRDNTDDSFYVNVAVSLADHPDWGLFSRNTLHGLKGPPPAMYHITSFELLGGLISWLTGIPALLVIHIGLGTLGGIAIPIALARLFRCLDPERWRWLMLFALTLYLFDGSTQFGFSMHGIARIYQGKAIMWTVAVPLAAVYAMELGAAPSIPRMLRLCAAQIAGIGLSSTGLWMMPAVALIGVLVPFAWDRRSVRGALLGCASLLYPVAVALWVRSQLLGDSPTKTVVATATAALAAGPDFEAITDAIFRSLGHFTLALAYGAMLLTATITAPNRLARRYLVAYTFVVVVVLTNPYTFSFVRKNLLGGSTHERGLWLLPLPAALAFFAAALVPSPRAQSAPRWQKPAGAAIGAAVLALFYATLPTRTNMPRRHLRFPPGPKVQILPFKVATKMAELLPEGAFVVADRQVSVHLPLLQRPPMPVMAKETFFSGAQLERRMALRDAVMRRLEPVVGERAAWLRSELDFYRVRGVVPTRGSERTKGLADTLKRAGFRRAATIDKYRLWIRDHNMSK